MAQPSDKPSILGSQQLAAVPLQPFARVYDTSKITLSDLFSEARQEAEGRLATDAVSFAQNDGDPSMPPPDGPGAVVIDFSKNRVTVRRENYVVVVIGERQNIRGESAPKAQSPPEPELRQTTTDKASVDVQPETLESDTSAQQHAADSPGSHQISGAETAEEPDANLALEPQPPVPDLRRLQTTSAAPAKEGTDQPTTKPCTVVGSVMKTRPTIRRQRSALGGKPL